MPFLFNLIWLEMLIFSTTCSNSLSKCLKLDVKRKMFIKIYKVVPYASKGKIFCHLFCYRKCYLKFELDTCVYYLLLNQLSRLYMEKLETF